MKFSCGDDCQTRCGRAVAKQRRLESWHDHFALLPCTVGQRDGKDICCWLETIERRIIPGCKFLFEYRQKVVS